MLVISQSQIDAYVGHRDLFWDAAKSSPYIESICMASMYSYCSCAFCS